MFKLRLGIPLLYLMLTLAYQAAAQQYSFKHKFFSLEDGLSSRFLTNVVQDDQGFIWIGSDFGINRFDGRDFKQFNASNSRLRTNSRSYLCKDVNGKIWVNNDRQQVDILDPVTEEVTQLEKLFPQFQGKKVSLIVDRLAGEVWGVVNVDTFFQYDGALHFYNSLPKRPTGMENRLFPSRWNSFYLRGNPGLTEYGARGQTLNNYPDIPFNNYMIALDSTMCLVSFDMLSSQKREAYPNIWQLRKDKAPELLKLTQQGKRFKVVLKRADLWSIGVNQDQQGRLWFLVQDQLFVFDKNGELLAAAPKFEETGGGSQLNSKNIFIDRQGEAWVCGLTGIYVLSIVKNGFRKLLASPYKIEMSVRGITGLADGQLLACTYKGIFKMNLQTGQANKLSDDIFYGVLQTGDASIWLGQHSGKVCHTSLKDWSKTEAFTAPSLPVDDEFLRPFEDTFTGKTYIGCRRQGLLVFDEKKRQLVPYPKLNGFTELAQSEINFVAPRQGFIWVATDNGLYKLDRSKGIVARFNQFPQNHIYHFSEDANGIFWLATRGGGLIRWDSNTGAVKQYTTDTGLSNNIIYAVYDDGLGYLWLSSNLGLMRLEKSTGVTFNYLVSDGITHEEFNTSSHYRAADGTLYFGGLNGITVVNPADIVSYKNEAAMAVTGFHVLKKNQLMDGMGAFRQTGEITVQPGQQFFTIDFALQDFLSKKQQYAWKLEGLDNEWTAQTENTIRLNALPFGNFVLRVRGKGDGIGWSSQELAIPIHVIRPFYRTWKFAMLLLLTAALLTYLYSQWRLRRLKADRQRLSHIVEARTQELVDKNAELESLNSTKDRLFTILAHDLRSPLVTLGGLARKVAFLIRQNRIPEVMELGETVEKSVANVRNLLDNLLKWAIVQDGKFPHHPELLSAHELAEEVVWLYKAVAEAKGIHLVYKKNGDPCFFADRNSVSTILRNLVDNALKFTHENGTVELSVKNGEKGSTITVSDTGIGIAPSELAQVFTLKNSKGSLGTKGEKGNGLGLPLCRELAEINHGTIEVYPGKGGGTSFVVTLPAVPCPATSAS